MSVKKLHDFVRPLRDQWLPGGCERCDAYQAVRLTYFGVTLTIHHDDWCPVLKSHRNGGRND